MKVMAAYRQVDGLVTLTACTPGSALGPTLGNEYGRALPLPLRIEIPAQPIPSQRVCECTIRLRDVSQRNCINSLACQ